MSDELQTVQLWSQRLTTASTVVIWVRHNANGALSVVANGSTFTGVTDINTAVDDGTGVVTITGLAANTVYPVIIRVGGVDIHTGTVKTNPAAVSTFNVSVSGCWGNSGMPAIYETINDWAVCSHFRLGDFPYTMAMSPRFVSAAVDLDTLAANTVDNMYIAQRSAMCTSDIQAMDHSGENILRDDDHDFHGGDNYTNSWESLANITQPNPLGPRGAEEIAGVTTQLQCNDLHALSAQAKRAYYKGTSYPTDANLLAGSIPFPATRGGLTPDAADYPVEFSVKRIGEVDFFVLGCIDNKTQEEDWNGTQGGQTEFAPEILCQKQRDAIEAAYTASTAKEVVFMSSKSLNSANGDGFWDYSVNRRWLIDLINTKGKDTFFIASDYHRPSVFELSPTAPQPENVTAIGGVTILDITVSPCGSRPIANPAPVGRNSIFNRVTSAVGVLHCEAGKFIQFVLLDERGKAMYYSPRKFFNLDRFVQSAPPTFGG
jgi:hypothetical protein